MIHRKKICAFCVGHLTYRVKWQKNKIDGRFVGQIDPPKHLVKMQSGRFFEDELETILHEMLHSASIVLGERLNEKVVTRLAALMAQALLTAK